jgi:hypothetical protein
MTLFDQPNNKGATMKMTLKIIAAMAVIGFVGTPAEAGRWSRDRTIEKRPATPAPAIPGIPDATLQYRQEYARVNAMLARNPNIFGGFNTTNTLDELRAQVDANISLRQSRELDSAKTPAEKARLTAAHAAFWDGLAARRELRKQFTDEQNIVHSLMMILKTGGRMK